MQRNNLNSCSYILIYIFEAFFSHPTFWRKNALTFSILRVASRPRRHSKEKSAYYQMYFSENSIGACRSSPRPKLFQGWPKSLEPFQKKISLRISLMFFTGARAARSGGACAAVGRFGGPDRACEVYARVARTLGSLWVSCGPL